MENVSFPSDTSDGYTGDCICSTCGERISTGFVIHNLVEGKCYVCGIQVPQCNHEVTYMVNVKYATCTTDGYLGDKICVACNYLVEAGRYNTKLWNKD